MRAAARGAADRLLDLFGDELFEVPRLAVAALPRGVGRQIVGQADQGERELRVRLARELLLLDEVDHGERFRLDCDRRIQRHAALGENGEILGRMPLHPDTLLGHEPVAGRREHDLPPAAASHVHPADRIHEITSRAADTHLGRNAERDEPVHHLPGRIVGCVERSLLVGGERLADQRTQPSEAFRLWRLRAGALPTLRRFHGRLLPHHRGRHLRRGSGWRGLRRRPPGGRDRSTLRLWLRLVCRVDRGCSHATGRRLERFGKGDGLVPGRHPRGGHRSGLRRKRADPWRPRGIGCSCRRVLGLRGRRRRIFASGARGFVGRCRWGRRGRNERLRRCRLLAKRFEQTLA